MWKQVVSDTFKKAIIGLPKSVPISPTSDEPTEPDAVKRVPVAWELSLSRPLTTYMQALLQQRKMQELIRTVDEVQQMGFRLTHKNWNDYIQHLAAARRWKTAFQMYSCRNGKAGHESEQKVQCGIVCRWS
ncbi:translation regulator (Cya5) protein [Rutstroemia sp. NJR-2017a BBW]|nr:translation regulator (Cya5) protein [Rutstroemia sp. NJR-2017a BBW]